MHIIMISIKQWIHRFFNTFCYTVAEVVVAETVAVVVVIVASYHAQCMST